MKTNPLSIAMSVALLFATAAAVSETPAAAGEGTALRDKHASRYAAPPKDCTRYNGRWGFYGNPWCTPAEQRAFDLWEARRLNAQRLTR